MGSSSWRTAFAVSLLAAAAMSCGSNGPSSGDSAGGNDGGTASAMSPATDFVRFAESDFSGEDADYVAEGLRGLAGALGTLNVGTEELTVDLRVAAEHVLLQPTTEETTATVIAGLLSVARALDAAQETGPGLLPLAEALRPDVPLPDQVTQVREFFQRCAQAIQSLIETAST